MPKKKATPSAILSLVVHDVVRCARVAKAVLSRGVRAETATRKEGKYFEYRRQQSQDALLAAVHAYINYRLVDDDCEPRVLENNMCWNTGPLRGIAYASEFPYDAKLHYRLPESATERRVVVAQRSYKQFDPGMRSVTLRCAGPPISTKSAAGVPDRDLWPKPMVKLVLDPKCVADLADSVLAPGDTDWARLVPPGGIGTPAELVGFKALVDRDDIDWYLLSHPVVLALFTSDSPFLVFPREIKKAIFVRAVVLPYRRALFLRPKSSCPLV
jgi:hypothetical protein